MNQLQPIEHNNQRILTTQQLAEAYGTDANNINVNFHNNKDRYTPGKHYYALEGEELKQFLSLHLKNLQVQNVSKIRTLYLWTEKGAWLHAKSLNTDRAWEAYEMLVDDYYRIKEQPQPATALPPAPDFDVNFTLHCRSVDDLRRVEKAIAHIKKAQALITGDDVPQIRIIAEDEIRPSRTIEEEVARHLARLAERGMYPSTAELKTYMPNYKKAAIAAALETLVGAGLVEPRQTNRTTRYLLAK